MREGNSRCITSVLERVYNRVQIGLRKLMSFTRKHTHTLMQ